MTINSVVTVCSNIQGVEPLGRTKRRMKEKGEIFVAQPNEVKEYNVGMGGVDLMDRALFDFRPCIQAASTRSVSDSSQ